MIDLSVIIPSRTDQYLQQTVSDILAKFRTQIEVIVVLDGYDTTLNADPRLRVLRFPYQGMRAGINAGVAAAEGRFVMKVDEHCLFAEGFDEHLLDAYRPGYITVPRRYRLDAENWKVLDDGRPPIDYMRLKVDDGYLHGVEWKRPDRAHLLVDTTPSMQGSCWMMARPGWVPMDDTHYGPFAQEAQELGMRAWLSGAGITVTKQTWYAHWHRKSGYHFTHEQQRAFQESVAKGRAYSYQFWTSQPYFYDWLKRENT